MTFHTEDVQIRLKAPVIKVVINHATFETVEVEYLHDRFWPDSGPYASATMPNKSASYKESTLAGCLLGDGSC